MRVLLIIFCLLISVFACAQDATQRKVIYHSNRSVELSTQLSTTELNRILINKNTELTWLDGHNAEKYKFSINSITGGLKLDKSGAVIYQVTSEKASGRFTVKKTNALIRITAMLIIEGKPTSLEFEVVSYNVID